MSFFENLTIKTRIFLICFTFFWGLCVTAGFSLFELTKIGKHVDEIAELKVPLVEKLSQVTIHQLETTIDLERFLRVPSEDLATEILDFSAKVKNEIIEAEHLIEQHIDLAIDEKDRQKLLSYLDKLKQIEKSEDIFIQELKALIASAREQDFQDYDHSLEKKVESHAIELSHTIEKLTLNVEHDTVKVAKQAEYIEKRAINYVLFLSIFSIVVCLLFAIFIARFTNQKIRDISKQIINIGKEIEVTTKDLSLFSKSFEKLHEDQDSSIENTSSSAYEIKQMAEQNLKNTDSVKKASNVSSDSTQGALDSTKKLDATMTEIVSSQKRLMSQSKNSADNIDEISNVISEISNEVMVINDIVFQTKLLSFNASVEAARAGEHGKGFAVVAEEVGNLASLSGKAAGQINQIIDSSVKKVEEMAAQMRTEVDALEKSSKESIEQGLKQCEFSRHELENIATEITKVDSLAEGSVSGVREQLVGVENIDKKLTTLSDISSKAKALTKQNIEIVGKLERNAASLNVVRSNFIQLTGSGTLLESNEASAQNNLVGILEANSDKQKAA